MRLVLLSLAAACAGGSLAWAAGPPPSERCLRDLVGALGDDDFDTRREAAARLRGWAAAVPLLDEALLLGDLETRKAAAALLRPHEAGRARAANRRIAGFLAEGRFDLLPDLAVRWGPADTKEHGFQAASFAGNLCRSRALSRAKGAAGKLLHENIWSCGLPLDSWTSRARRSTPWRTDISNAIDTRLGYQAQFAANSIRVNGTSTAIYLSAGKVYSYDGELASAVIIANGDVTVDRHLGSYGSIIICDGTVSLASAIDSIIIARGGIRFTGAAGRGNYFSCGGKLKVPAALVKTSHVEEDAKRPLGLVRFFAVSDVGLTLDALAVKAIDPKCALALAGLGKGDAFISIDGTAVKDADALRRALRKRFAIGGIGLFTVERGGKTLTIRTRLAE